MESASQHSPKRLLRLAIAGGILATAWFAVDAITHSEPAAAAETIDLLPIGDGSTGGVVTGILGGVTDLVTPVTSALPPVVTPVVNAVTAPVKPVITQVVNPVVTTVVAPITTPIVSAVVTPVAPIITGITNPVGQIVTTITQPLNPILDPVIAIVAPVATSMIQPLTPALETVLPPLTVLDSAVELVPTVSATTPNGTVLAVGGTVLLGAVLAVMAAPLIPAPSNGGPLNAPLAPAAPSGSNGSFFVAFYGELNSGIPAGIGAFGTVGANVDDLPSSPTFASDTTPD